MNQLSSFLYIDVMRRLLFYTQALSLKTPRMESLVVEKPDARPLHFLLLIHWNKSEPLSLTISSTIYLSTRFNVPDPHFSHILLA